ncbi:hypothetical protein TSUD_89410 [Trifolium subterraneum]|uniref:Pentatricopeptide repeat-containing protein n=1 Tax=Trifolium subterraneum TaxID=3900 RepID=A0A2Z6LM09_TRISU|nr:hypothetical protein TSUD_89410 [Trifolium subterraneum]
MLSAYVGADGYETEALDLFARMQSARDTIGIDEFTLTTMLNFTAKLRVVCYGKQMHSYMVKTASDLSKFASSSLINMYAESVYEGIGIKSQFEVASLILYVPAMPNCNNVRKSLNFSESL